MTSEVANGEKDRFVFFAGFFEGRVAPRIPIHRIMGMQEQVRTLRMDESVGVRVLYWPIAPLSGLTVSGLSGDRCLSSSATRAPEGSEQYADMK